MEPALFINSNSARKAMGRVKWFHGRQIHMRAVFSRSALLGYHVVINGLPMTENKAASDRLNF